MSEIVEINLETMFNPAAIKLIKNMYAKDATNDELSLFLTTAKMYGLIPGKHIFFMKYASKPCFYTGRDGFVKIANDHRDAEGKPDHDGIQSAAIRANDLFELTMEDATKGITFKHKIQNFGNRGDVVGAWAIVRRKNITMPFIAVVSYTEVKVDTNQLWKTKPEAMCRKAAEIAALRLAYQVAGILSDDELEGMRQAETVTKKETKRAKTIEVQAEPSQGEEDDLAELLAQENPKAEEKKPEPPKAEPKKEVAFVNPFTDFLGELK